ncbi:hypothetical protein BpHYR1_008308 [Brachionus plicatilis]|uniref:Uncharacterized protein n=1 Tax=Brachionus plicatilis TaxID=10195 RepID=A0A3M7PW71_BRAPC|nr:hypothetical protein BpHYR1_008308 [Brachionus plicatilis]
MLYSLFSGMLLLNRLVIQKHMSTPIDLVIPLTWIGINHTIIFH